MPSAVDFFPLSMSVFMNVATSLSRWTGSGRIFRFGTSRRRDMVLTLRALHAVLRPLAIAVRFVGARRTGGSRRVERAAHDVIPHGREILHTTSANEHDAVL